MPDALETALDALAVARLTHLAQQDTIWPLPALRTAVLDRWGDRPVADLVDCPWCASPYLAALVLVARRAFPRAWPLAARVLAFSAVAGHLEAR